MPSLCRTTAAGAALLAAVAAVWAGPTRAGALLRGQSPSLAGEQGLWVEEEADRTLTVRWITAAADSGYLRVLEGGRPGEEFRTPAARAHAVALRPRGPRVTLEYGALRDTAARHRTTLDPRPPQRPRVSRPAPDSLFVVGDVHGEHHRLLQLLRNARLVDAAGNWTGGRSQLVFLGDLVDRGAEATRTLWLVYRLERQAEAAGGRVHVVLGNHEVMVLTSDLRYVAPGELAVAEAHGVGYARLYDPRRSHLGRWLASKPALMRIGRVLLAHGGVPPVYGEYSLQAFDDSLAAYQREELFLRWSDTTYAPRMDSAAFARRLEFFWGDGSVLWHRGYVQSDTLTGALASALRGFGANLMVVAHTPQPTMSVRYGGALIATHPRQPALEMLLLVPSGASYRRYRYLPNGPREEF